MDRLTRRWWIALGMLSLVDEKEMLLEEISFSQLKDEYLGKTLEDMDILNSTGVSIILIKHDGAYRFNPDPETILQEGNVAILLGPHSKIEEFENLYCK